MKKTVALLLILVLCLSSCKVANEEKAYIDETIAATETKEKETEQVEEEKSEQITETENVTVVPETENDNTLEDPVKQSETEDDSNQSGNESEQQTNVIYDDNSSQQSNPQYEDGTQDEEIPISEENEESNQSSSGIFPHDQLALDAPNTKIQGYYRLDIRPFRYITYNEESYMRGIGDWEYMFPECTIYENVDLSQLKPTGETVVVNYVENDLGEKEDSVTAEIYNLPEQMQNDPYVNMLAVKLPDEEVSLFFSPNTERKNGDKLYKELLLDNRFCGHQCLSAEDVDTILLSRFSYEKNEIEKQATITDADSLRSIYDSITQATFTSEAIEPDSSIPEFFISVFIRFKDNTSTSYTYQSNTKTIIQGRYNLNGEHKATEEFEQLLLSYLS